MNNDLYKILGIDRNATAVEIRKAYLKLVKRKHPDVVCRNKSNSPEYAQKEFENIQKAYETLSDPKKKEFYDRHGTTLEDKEHEQINPGNFFANDLMDFFANASQTTFQHNETIIVDLNTGKQTFSGKDFSQTRTKKSTTKIKLSFKEASYGFSKNIKIEVLYPCSNCYDTSAGIFGICPICHGKKVINSTENIKIEIKKSLLGINSIIIPNKGHYKHTVLGLVRDNLIVELNYAKKLVKGKNQFSFENKQLNHKFNFKAEEFIFNNYDNKYYLSIILLDDTKCKLKFKSIPNKDFKMNLINKQLYCYDGSKIDYVIYGVFIK